MSQHRTERLGHLCLGQLEHVVRVTQCVLCGGVCVCTKRTENNSAEVHRASGTGITGDSTPWVSDCTEERL